MRATILLFCALALAAPTQAAIRLKPRRTPAEAASIFANSEASANGLGWNRFVHAVATNGGARAVPALAAWAMMVGGFGGAGALLRRRPSSRI